MTGKLSLKEKLIGLSASLDADSDEYEKMKATLNELVLRLIEKGARIAYSGDLRKSGIDLDLRSAIPRKYEKVGIDPVIVNYITWPTHICKTWKELEKMGGNYGDCIEFVYLDIGGNVLSKSARKALPTQEIAPKSSQYKQGLTSMREMITKKVDARIVIGGKTTDYSGVMPGTAEEVLYSIENKKPIFLLGWFRGCAADIAFKLRLTKEDAGKSPSWERVDEFDGYCWKDLRNGLEKDDNILLATMIVSANINMTVDLMVKGISPPEK